VRTMNIVKPVIQRHHPLLATKRPIISAMSIFKMRIIVLDKTKRINTIINAMASKNKTNIRGKSNTINHRRIRRIIKKMNNTIIVTELSTKKQENGHLLPRERLLRPTKGIFLSIRMNFQG